ncbi:MAG TPA: hypothetical protein VKV06_01240, partial [Acidimicrobiales bacterium]|nr:hypothetical protein [Acidimicrobiales bacterium]
MPPLLHGEAEDGRHRRPHRALRAPLRTAPGQEGLIRPDPAAGVAEADRLANLRQVKLRALVRAHWGAGGDTTSEAWGTAAAVLHDPRARRAWVLLDDGDPRGLGPALAWADRHDVADLAVLVETAGEMPDEPGVVARRAACFARPPQVLAVSGRDVAVAQPLPPERPAEPPAGAVALMAPVAGAGSHPAGGGTAGITVVAEHGTVTAEILGLEVARVVPGPAGEWRLEVGVGRYDREARAEMFPGEDTVAALDQAAAEVAAKRRPGLAAHPANTLVKERW